MERNESNACRMPVSELIRTPPYPPRSQRSADEFLVSSVRLHGLLSPLLARRAEDGPQVVCGYRRLLAASAAGLAEVPVLLVSLGDAEAIRSYLSENLCRQELDAGEREAALGLLRELRDAATPWGRIPETGGTGEIGSPGAVSLVPRRARSVEAAVGEGSAAGGKVAELIAESEAFFAEVRERRRIDVGRAREIVRALLALPPHLRPLAPEHLYTGRGEPWIPRHALFAASLHGALAPGSFTALGSEGYAIAGFLHDAGMVFVDDSFLSGPRRVLGHEQRRAIRSHTRIGHALVSAAGVEYAEIALVARDHHERLDGSGYPNGLREDELGRLVRLAALVDSYCSMTGYRPYRKPLLAPQAMERLGRATEMGLYDPQLFRELADLLASGRRGGGAALSGRRGALEEVLAIPGLPAGGD